MIRVFVVYEEEPDAARYEQHVELAGSVPGVTFRHGKMLRALRRASRSPYYAEFEFPDSDAFKAVADAPSSVATGKDAAKIGYPVPCPLRRRRVTEPDRTAPAPAGGAGLRDDRLREGAAAGDDHAE